jgi:transcriptional regulator of NAD metabolism
MDPQLWNRLRQEPNASKSTLQIESERSQREYQASLKNVKPVVTAEQRKAAADRFRQIQAQNELDKSLDELDVVNQRAKEVEHNIIAALEVCSPSEKEEALRRLQPKIQHFILHTPTLK